MAKKSTTHWVPFHFESNQYFGMINGPEDWQDLRNAYPEQNDVDFLSAKESTYKGHRSEEARAKKPMYGFRIECDGEPLLNHFKRNYMKIPAIKVDSPE